MTLNLARIFIALMFFCSYVSVQADSDSDKVVEQLQGEALSSDLAWE